MTAIHSCLLIPLKEMFANIVNYIPTLIVAFAILVLGYLIAKLLREVMQKVFTEIGLDKAMDKLGLSKCFHANGVKHSVSHILISVVYLIVIYVFLIMTIHVVGIYGVSTLVGSIVGYILNVISAVMVLVVGSVLAKIMGDLIYLVMSKLELPNPKLHERVTRWAILLYAVKISLSELGFGYLLTGTVFMIWFGGLVLGLALAFGLGGRDAAAKYFSKK